jgi:hypothetical protein
MTDLITLHLPPVLPPWPITLSMLLARVANYLGGRANFYNTIGVSAQHSILLALRNNVVPIDYHTSQHASACSPA